MRTIQSELTKKGYVKPSIESYPITRRKINENLTDREWKELMGCNKDRLTRGKGEALERYKKGGTFDLKELLVEYRLTLKETRKLLKKIESEIEVSKYDKEYLVGLEEDKKVINSWISNLQYSIEWITIGKRPGARREIGRRASIDREVPFEPYWIQLRKDESENVESIERLFDDEDQENEIIKEASVKEITKILNDKQKEILTLKADGATHNEIAESLRIPKGTVDVTMKRIKEKIKAEGWFML